MITPFVDAEEAWFWFMASEKARAEGANPRSGYADIERPCQPADIYVTVTRLRQRGVLQAHHVLVLKFFGERFKKPNPTIYGSRGGGERRDERQAAKWWKEAMLILEPYLQDKGIVYKYEKARR